MTMKKVVLFIFLLLLATIIFLGVTFFLGNTNGKGALQVTSTPKASVYLNGKKIGNTPLCKCETEDLIKIGEYAIKLIPTQGDFKPFEEKITINKSTLTVFDREFSEGAQRSSSIIISLISIPNKKDAELSVISLPSDANVFLDNNIVGTTPLAFKDSAPSDHNLIITKEGYKDKSIGIKTVEGYKLTALISLGVLPVSSPSAEQTATTSATTTLQKVIILDTPNGFLRVRESNSIYSPEMTRVSDGEIFELIDEKDGWFEIKLASPAGKAKTGWISGQYAEKE